MLSAMKKLIALLLIIPAMAQADEHATSVLKALAGAWEGELYYLDYRSGQRFGIPMGVDAELTPDGATLIRRLTFTDPGNLVHAVNLSTVDRDTGELVEAYFREGKGEMNRYEIVSADFSDEGNWELVYEQDGTDDDRPARIRHTISRNGDSMTSRKEVRFLDEEGDFFLRNGTELDRVAQKATSRGGLSPINRSRDIDQFMK